MSKVRLQVELRAEEAEALDALAESCGMRSRADAVRTALAVAGWIKGEAREGNRLVSIGDRGDPKILVIPGLTD